MDELGGEGWQADRDVVGAVGGSRWHAEEDRELLSKLFAQLPIVAERIGDAAGAPAVLFLDRRHRRRAGGDRLLEYCVWIVDRQDHPHRSGTTGVRTGVGIMLDPEQRPADRELGDFNGPPSPSSR